MEKHGCTGRKENAQGSEKRRQRFEASGRLSVRFSTRAYQGEVNLVEFPRYNGTTTVSINETKVGPVTSEFITDEKVPSIVSLSRSFSVKISQWTSSWLRKSGVMIQSRKAWRKKAIKTSLEIRIEARPCDACGVCTGHITKQQYLRHAKTMQPPSPLSSDRAAADMIGESH